MKNLLKKYITIFFIIGLMVPVILAAGLMGGSAYLLTQVLGLVSGSILWVFLLPVFAILLWGSIELMPKMEEWGKRQRFFDKDLLD